MVYDFKMNKFGYVDLLFGIDVGFVWLVDGTQFSFMRIYVGLFV